MAKLTWNIRKITARKYRAVQRRYKELYEDKRLRHDDVIENLMEEFYYTDKNTVYRILATEVPEPETIEA